MGRNKVKKVMKKLCVCMLSAVIGMLSIQIMPVSAASKTGMGKITNKINKAGYNYGADTIHRKKQQHMTLISMILASMQVLLLAEIFH